jgi:enoyl-CoA hydratase/carnithine racemase
MDPLEGSQFMSTHGISYSRSGRLAVIRLERPEALNAITGEMVREMERLALAAERDPDVVALCITGEGRGFCAGLDVGLLAQYAQSGAPEAPKAEAGDTPALFGFLLGVSKPVIAAINGVAAGGGLVLAMMCDLRFMAEGANITTIFSKRGLIAEHGTSWFLPRMIGLSRALDLLWSSRKVDAAEAYRIGLADRVVPADELMRAVEAYVADLAANVSPRSLAVIKAQVHRHLGVTYDQAIAETGPLMQEALGHPDATEGVVSYSAKRPPNFVPWTGGA